MQVIKTPRLFLRPLQRRDAVDITRLLSNFEVLRWLARPPHPYALGDARTFISATLARPESAQDTVRVIALDRDGPLIGTVAIEEYGEGPMLGYWLGQSYWGRGFMSEAAGALTHHFFANPANMALQSAYISGNEASAAIQRRLGFDMVAIGFTFSAPLGCQVPDIKTCLTRARYEMLKR